MTPETAATPPLSLPPELLAAVRRIAGTERLLVAMDFDGTISPIVDHADAARRFRAGA